MFAVPHRGLQAGSDAKLITKHFFSFLKQSPPKLLVITVLKFSELQGRMAERLWRVTQVYYLDCANQSSHRFILRGFESHCSHHYLRFLFLILFALFLWWLLFLSAADF